jgi:hypothetical protein
MTEKILHRQVCTYLKLQYPSIIFNSDLSGATKLTINQATQMKALRSSKGFPDIVIYEPRGIYHGLFIELKKEGTKLFNKKYEPATDHLKEQFDMMNKLSAKGYSCHFAIGFESAKKILDEYLQDKK